MWLTISKTILKMGTANLDITPCQKVYLLIILVYKDIDNRYIRLSILFILVLTSILFSKQIK